MSADNSDSVPHFTYWDRNTVENGVVKHRFGFGEGKEVELVETVNGDGRARYIGFAPDRETMPEPVQLEDFEYCDDGGVTMPYPFYSDGRWNWRWQNSIDAGFSHVQPMTPEEQTAFLTVAYFSELAGTARPFLVSPTETFKTKEG